MVIFGSAKVSVKFLDNNYGRRTYLDRS